MKLRLILPASVIALVCCPVWPMAWARQAGEHHTGHGVHAETGELGNVDFPTSCPPTVQKSFERGVALLHSFWYEEAEAQFEEILRTAPGCAMAHWGVAMSLYHPLWDRPDKPSLERGLAELVKAEASGEKTAREQEYLAALGAFYRDSEKLSHEARTTSYAHAMEQLALRHSEDREAKIFYALALLGSEPKPDPGFVNRKKAAAVLEKIFLEVPDHPGVAHYLIHAYDNPQFATLGLPAALRYAKIAPAAPHALHMPSHIFNRVGLWQESIASNLASASATRKSAMGHMGDASHQLHAMDFLSYAYIQIGRESDALEVLDQVKAIPGMERGEMHYILAELPARDALELHHWEEAAALSPPDGAGPGIALLTYRARTIGAARSGNVAQARRDLEKITSLQETRNKNFGTYGESEANVNVQEARAWVEYAEGNADQALKTMRAAAELEETSGPVQLAIPAREMLADMLLELKRPADALTEYEASLKVAPNRFGELYGAARAATLAGKSGQASTYYLQLLKNCDGGTHSGRPELKQARVLAAK